MSTAHAPRPAAPSIPAARRAITMDLVRLALDHLEMVRSIHADVVDRLGLDRHLDGADDIGMGLVRDAESAATCLILGMANHRADTHWEAASWSDLDRKLWPPAAVTHRGKLYVVAPEPSFQSLSVGEAPDRPGLQVMFLSTGECAGRLDFEVTGLDGAPPSPRLFDDVEVPGVQLVGLAARRAEHDATFSREARTDKEVHILGIVRRMGEDAAFGKLLAGTALSPGESALLTVARKVSVDEALRRIADPSCWPDADLLTFGPVTIDASKCFTARACDRVVPADQLQDGDEEVIEGFELEFPGILIDLFGPEDVARARGWWEANRGTPIPGDGPEPADPPAPPAEPEGDDDAPPPRDARREAEVRHDAAVGRGRRSLLVTSTIYDSDRITRKGLAVAEVLEELAAEYDASDDGRVVWEDGRIVGLLRWRPDGTPEAIDFDATDRA